MCRVVIAKKAKKVCLWYCGAQVGERMTMPSKSEAQRKAMQAAAHGKSTIGIPASVGKEFAAADSAKRKKGPFKLPKIKGQKRGK